MQADPDQLEQLLINLMRNAVDAALETGGAVQVGWQQNSHRVSVFVEDEGPGLANPSNLFVPFFTTKPQGSGIGLVLGRQIAEAHGGTLTLEPRAGAKGARATVTLPSGFLPLFLSLLSLLSSPLPFPLRRLRAAAASVAFAHFGRRSTSLGLRLLHAALEPVNA